MCQHYITPCVENDRLSPLPLFVCGVTSRPLTPRPWTSDPGPSFGRHLQRFDSSLSSLTPQSKQPKSQRAAETEPRPSLRGEPVFAQHEWQLTCSKSPGPGWKRERSRQEGKK
uniref:Uncharacterized protein n=1 Tax=Knipowitschia caucasica TaxID=637954 RepID=A0AAV2KVP9_KNICA